MKIVSTPTKSPHFQNRFNAAAWTLPDSGNTMLMIREVKIGTPRGIPDKGDMVLLELNPRGDLIGEKTIWKPEDKQYLLEDPRALVLDRGKVLLGFTAVDEINNLPFPALVKLDNHKNDHDLNDRIEVIKDFGPGKNTTPVDEDTFFFRQDGEENNHKLFVFSKNDTGLTGHTQIDFPRNISWASWRIGTTMPPIWINKNEALMIFHGIKIVGGKYIYSLGRAKLFKSNDDLANKRYSVEVDPKALLTPDDFLDSRGKPLIEELHPDMRRVVYACGGIQKKVNSKLVLALFTNVGDKQTVEVQIPWKDLIKGWWVN